MLHGTMPTCLRQSTKPGVLGRNGFDLRDALTPKKWIAWILIFNRLWGHIGFKTPFASEPCLCKIVLSCRMKTKAGSR